MRTCCPAILPPTTCLAPCRGACCPSIDPASGFIVNANNTPFQASGTGSELDPKNYSPLLGIETDTTNRATRALELFGSAPQINEADLETIKYDTGVSRRSWAARWYMDIARVDPRDDQAPAHARVLLAR